MTTSKWSYLIESMDHRFRQALRDYATGAISQIEFATIWKRTGEEDRLRALMNKRRWDIKKAIGCPGDKCPADFETEGEIDGFKVKLTKSTPGTRAHRLKVQCPICHAWVGVNAGKLGQHLKRRDHAGENMNKVKGAAPERVGHAMYKHVSSKKYGVKNLYPEARVSWSGGLLYISVDEKRPIKQLNKWMLEKYEMASYTQKKPSRTIQYLRVSPPPEGMKKIIYYKPREYWFTQ